MHGSPRPIDQLDHENANAITLPVFPPLPTAMWDAQTDVLERVDTSVPATGRQAAWNYLVFALSKSSTLVMTIVLARLLDPAEFGLFAFALLVVNLFDFVKDLGVGASLVQSRRRWDQIAPTGLTLSVVFGVLIGAVLAGTAGLTSDLVGHPDLEPLIQVLAIGLTISALSVVPTAYLRRNIDFRGRIFPEFIGALLKTILTIGLAVAGYGVWSLIWGQLAGVTVTMLLYWKVAGSTLRFGFDGPEAKSLLKFGLPVTAVTLLAFGIYNVDYLAIGSRQGDAELGLYTLAYRIPELLVLSLCGVISDVLFSSLSRLQHDLKSLGGHYVQTLGVVVALTAPIGIGLAVSSDALIATMYGSQYEAADPMLSVLAIYAVVYSASFHSGDVYKAIGRPGILTSINAGKFAALIVPIWWAAGHSAVLVAVALLSVELGHFVVRMIVVRRVLSLSWNQLVPSIIRPVAAAVVMGVALVGLHRMIRTLPAPLVLVLLALAGLLIYVVALRFTAPLLFASGYGIVMKTMGKNPTMTTPGRHRAPAGTRPRRSEGNVAPGRHRRTGPATARALVVSNANEPHRGVSGSRGRHRVVSRN